jgi:hypothetical protein
MALITYASVKWRQRAFLAMTTQIWVLPCLIALLTLPDNASAWSKYAAVTALLSYPSPHPLHVGWASANSNSVRTRAVSAALYNSLVQVSRPYLFSCPVLIISYPVSSPQISIVKTMLRCIEGEIEFWSVWLV